MKTKIIIFFSLCTISVSLIAQNPVQCDKISIAIGQDDTGIPLSKNNEGYQLYGFEVDSVGNFYFLTGKCDEFTTLLKFKGNRMILRKQYTDFNPNRLYLKNDSIIIFDNSNQKNSLFILNTADGTILDRKYKIIDKEVNSYAFTDSTLILQVIKGRQHVNINAMFGYVSMSFNGTIRNVLKHDYGLWGVYNLLHLK